MYQRSTFQAVVDQTAADAQLQQCQHRQRILGAVFHKQGHRITPGNTFARQGPGQLIDLAIKLTVGPLPIFENQHDIVRIAGHRILEH